MTDLARSAPALPPFSARPPARRAPLSAEDAPAAPAVAVARESGAATPPAVAGAAPERRLSFAYAKRHGVLVQEIANGSARCAYRAGASPFALAEVRRFLRLPLTVERVEEAVFDALLRQAYEAGSDAMQAVEGIEDTTDLAHLAQELPEQADLLESEDDAPIIRLINAVLTQAVKENASDIHIEPFENRLVVRFRVDGVLREVLQSKRAVAPLVVSRIKVMSKLDIAEKRLPQDGRIGLRIAGRAVDVRVSTVPSGHGERVVLRILDKQAGRLDLNSLGMDPKTEKLIDELIFKPHGILLVTGPTGSGKTTTLYAALERLNDHTRNIMTVEDPIEYYIDGIGQMQVNTKVEMTFARGLRAILRQDPDVVMVGEIRDLETAQIAVQASLTGHLVLSTLHTNTAVGAVTRLRDMGIEPFLLSSSLIGVLAQRLVRVLNPDSKQPFQAGEYERRLLNLRPQDPAPTLYRPGRDAGGGYRGRSGVYELVIVDDTMRTMIHDGAAEHELERYARTLTPSIREDGRAKVLAGETTLEEVLRVTRED
ncbi:MAG: type II secretion system ATPase GspE [Steroidobacteraceae bacterium]